MKNYIEELTKKFSEQFGRVAQEYLVSGLDMFHRYRESESEYGQAAVGILIAGTEMMIKSYLADRNLGNVFRKMPPDVRLFMSNPESIPRFYRWRTFEFDFRSELYKMIDFDDCIDCFYVFFPQLKQLLLPYIRHLSILEQPCLHSIVPTLNSFEFDRTGFAVLQIAEVIANDDSFDYIWYSLSDNDTEFLSDYKARRNERVALVMSQAKKAALEPSGESTGPPAGKEWESLPAACPVCKATGLLDGFTELAVGENEDGKYPGLDFFAVGYECDLCRLKLYDTEELHLAGMDSIYDRSVDLDRWFREHRYYSEWFMEGDIGI